MQKLAFISQSEYFNFIYDDSLHDDYEIRDYQMTFSMSPNEFQDLFSFNADYNIFFRGEYIPSEVLEKLLGKNINLSSEPFPVLINNTLNYSFDSIKRFLIFRNIRHNNFDYVFHYDKSSLPFLLKDGLHLSGEFVFPVATHIYQQKRIEKRWDVFFIGRCTTHREKYFGPVKEYNKFLDIAHGIWGRDVIDYISASKICLNIHAENEISWEPRMQMMMACGAFVISEPITPNDYLRPGIDYVEISHPLELLEAANYYLNNDEAREEIAKNGCERVREKLDSKILFRDLLEGINENRYPKFISKRGKYYWDFLNNSLNTAKHIKNRVFKPYQGVKQ